MKKLLLLFAILLIPALAHGATRYVATTGATTNCTTMQTISTPASSIGAALTCSIAGDTVYIRAGTYDERFDMPSSVTVAGYPGELPLIKPTTGSTGAINLLSNTGFTLRNLEISGQGLTMGDACVGGSAPTNALFEDLKIHDCVRGPGGSDATGIGLLLGGSGHTIRRLESYNNDNTDPSAAGDNGGYGLYFSGTGSTIENSYFHDNGGLGAQIYPTGGNTVRYNKFFHNGFTGRKNLGALTLGGPNNAAYSNVIWNNNYSGIDAHNCGGCVVYNNTIYSNGVATASFGMQFLSGSTMTQRNNIYQDNSGGNVIDWTAGGLVSSNSLCFGIGGTFGCAITATNPQFVAPTITSTADFSLQSNSPAINTGFTLSSPYATDILGTTRPQPAAGLFDIGAYEFSEPPMGCPSNPNLLAAQYSFNSVATDSAGNGAGTATLGTGVTYTTGKIGNGLTFTGVAGATVADANILDMCDQFSLMAWVQVPDTTTDRMFIVKNPNSKLFLGMLNGYCGTGAALVGGYSQIVTVIACDSTLLTTGVLTHVAVTYDGTTVRLYKNGFERATATGGAALDATTGTLQFCDSGFSEFCPSGSKLDEAKVYTYARSAAEVVTDTGVMSRTVKVAAGKTLKLGSQ